MAIRLSGMISGLDTDSIVEELVSAYSIKKDNLVKAQTKLEWKQDAWKEMNTKVYDFYSKSLSNLRFSNAFAKKVSSVNSTKAKVSASSDSVTGTQSLKITSLAKSGYLTGGVVKNASDESEKIKGSSKLSDLGISDSRIGVTVDGKTNSIDIKGDMTVNQFVAKLKESGVNASFDETNQRFFVSSKNSGVEGDFNLNAEDAEGLNSLKAMGLLVTTDKDMSVYEEMSNIDVEELTQEEYMERLTEHKNALTVEEELKDEITSLTERNATLGKEKDILDFKKSYMVMTDEDRTKAKEELNNRLKELKDTDLTGKTDEEKKAVTDEIATINSKLKAAKDVEDNYLKSGITAEDKQKYEDKLNEDITKKSEELTANADKIAANQAILDGTADASLGYTDLESYKDKLNADIDAANAELEQSIRDKYQAKKDMGIEMLGAKALVDNYASLANPTEEEKAQYEAALAKLGMGEGSAVRIAGADAKITLNGAEFTSNTNSFSINGLTIEASAITDPDEEITITTNQDTDGIYNMIKDFIKEYNSLVNEMDSKFNAKSAKGYEPLTDEEKESMTDDQIEKWEAKIKDALLRRDQTLDGISSALRNAMSKGIEIDGKNYTLASFGISTLGYFAASDNEKGAYHINGDPDDKATSGNADKLRKAIASDPETVTTFFNKLAQEMYTTLSNKMKASSIRSAYTVYNDKQMKAEYEEYDDKIKKWEDKITAYEERYRKQFAAMEKAMSNMNAQQSQLSSLLGS